jgi:hypothetical protein
MSKRLITIVVAAVAALGFAAASAQASSAEPTAAKFVTTSGWDWGVR